MSFKARAFKHEEADDTRRFRKWQKQLTIRCNNHSINPGKLNSLINYFIVLASCHTRRECLDFLCYGLG